MSSDDRRAPGMTRIPFEGLVEVGGALGPSFEAQAVNVSEDGMLLRTAYLPDAGQPLTCRFDAGGGQSVLASGEVVWTEGAEKGGEFAIRFTDMDPDSVEALKHLCGVTSANGAVGAAGVPTGPQGAKVRLHIEGLASPMRAKIRDAGSSAITVGSELGFLQVGKQLELEDAASGAKRPASIDRVEVQIDPASHVPQLVVTLRYAEASGTASSVAPHSPAPRTTGAAADDLAAVEEASVQMKGAVARHIARIGPAMERLAQRAKTTIALLAKRRAMRGDEASAPRRVTSPPAGGGLHATGKRVVRGEIGDTSQAPVATPRLKMTKRNAAIAGAVMVAAVLGAIALKKTHGDVPPTATTAGTAAATTSMTAPEVASMPTSIAPPAFDTPSPAPMPGTVTGGTGMVGGGPVAASDVDDSTGSTSKPDHKKHSRVAPFGNGAVRHGNILHLKLDGPIEAIEGAQQPTGFAVKLPGRKSLEAAGPLAARDSRIAAIKVSNDAAGAELTVAFKDGVPNYQVSAKGDTLVIALAPAGDLDKTVANKDDKGGKSSKHAGKHHVTHHKGD